MSGPVVGAVLTANDPQPEHGTIVRDDLGRPWKLWDDTGTWMREDNDDDDPESWTKVAGNYGPVTVLRVGYGDG